MHDSHDSLLSMDSARDSMFKPGALNQSKAPSWEIQLYKSSDYRWCAPNRPLGVWPTGPKQPTPQLHLYTCSLWQGMKWLTLYLRSEVQ